jgi:prophage regulatory protein
MSLKLSRLPAVKDAVGLSKTAIYRRIAAGEFPAPITLGARAVAWPDGEVGEVIAAWTAGRSNDEVRALVAKLHAARGGGPAAPKCSQQLVAQLSKARAARRQRNAA